MCIMSKLGAGSGVGSGAQAGPRITSALPADPQPQRIRQRRAAPVQQQGNQICMLGEDDEPSTAWHEADTQEADDPTAWEGLQQEEQQLLSGAHAPNPKASAFRRASCMSLARVRCTARRCSHAPDKTRCSLLLLLAQALATMELRRRSGPAPCARAPCGC